MEATLIRWSAAAQQIAAADREPRHMHVDNGPLTVKLWLDPDVRIADNHGFSRRELRVIERIAREHIQELRDAWDAFCNDQ